MHKVISGLVAVVGAGAVLVTSAAAGVSASGVVVGDMGNSMLVATSSGKVVAEIGDAAVGAEVDGGAVVGTATRACIHGTVVATKGATELVVSNHHLVAIHGSASSDADAGTIVTATVTPKASGRLILDSSTDDGDSSSSDIAVTGTIEAIGLGAVTFDVDGQDLKLDLAAGLTLPHVAVGTTTTVEIATS